MAEAAVMNGGIGKHSYANNSHFQRDGFNSAKNKIKKVIIESLDVKTLVSSNSNAFSIADLGCSVGPNTFLAMEDIIEAIELKYDSQVLNPTKLEFQVFFNDQVGNDFNTLFASLPPERQYFAAGVPGTFYDRLFPTRSIYLAFSSYSIHWLSQVPKQILNKLDSPAYNEGKIHYTGASKKVVQAYADQFEKDMEVFLCARSEEIVKGGMIIVIMPGVPDGTLTHDAGIVFNFLESILIDMIKEGIVKQDEVDTFNVPHVYPSVKQMSRIVEKNGFFKIENIELRNIREDTKTPVDIEILVMHIRALAEGTFTNHFGSKTVDEIFKRAIRQKSKLYQMLDSSEIERAVILFTVLKRI